MSDVDYFMKRYGYCLTAEELCQELKIKKQTMHNRMSLGTFEIPHFKVGKALRFKSEDVANAINSLQTSHPTS